jgi:hypothetical protein
MLHKTLGPQPSEAEDLGPVGAKPEAAQVNRKKLGSREIR